MFTLAQNITGYAVKFVCENLERFVTFHFRMQNVRSFKRTLTSTSQEQGGQMKSSLNSCPVKKGQNIYIKAQFESPKKLHQPS